MGEKYNNTHPMDVPLISPKDWGKGHFFKKRKYLKIVGSGLCDGVLRGQPQKLLFLVSIVC